MNATSSCTFSLSGPPASSSSGLVSKYSSALCSKFPLPCPVQGKPPLSDKKQRRFCVTAQAPPVDDTSDSALLEKPNPSTSSRWMSCLRFGQRSIDRVRPMHRR
ncbi:hypothetical protein KP509_25G061200 [Ceratopteris richardii]|uniref:Uncharacterized protein n=1 Tax=Ceratopteris richardii TaxID=49495 RepID=A0A8T2RSC1_CERRI|nr:hypothetical protein KP509_25G061200 [Ceratopteris richardii]